MKKSLYVVTLAALLVMTLLAGCQSGKISVQTTAATEAPITSFVETNSAVDEVKPTEAKPTEVKEEKPAATEAKPVEVKEEKPVTTEAKPAAAKEQKPAATEVNPVETERISRDEAKAKAIAHAKVASDKVRDLDIELEKERGVTFYEVSFDVERMEYEYAIEAYTGEILWNRTERDW